MKLIHFFRDIACAMAVAVTSLDWGDGETQISVKYASDYVQPTAGLSVFGVFENGRLSPESWNDIGPTLSSRINKASCETAWTNNFITATPQQGTLKQVAIAKANTRPSSQRYLARLTLMFAD